MKYSIDFTNKFKKSLRKGVNMFEQMPFSEKYPVFRKLAEIGDLRKLSREELELYDEDIKNMRDIYATRKFDEKNKKRLLGGSRTYREPPFLSLSPITTSHAHRPVSLARDHIPHHLFPREITFLSQILASFRIKSYICRRNALKERLWK